jgi:arsenite methyltransferase
MGLGCGNPLALASLVPGETVVDLGSGGGFDCFLAAEKVGAGGQVIGVDMTPDMVAKARMNADKAAAGNVSFRLGEIEHLPIADNHADIIISNCVVNLSPDKRAVYREAYRVLKPGGRIAISDILATAPLPDDIRDNLALVSACIGGAATIEETHGMLTEAGFEKIHIEQSQQSRQLIEAYAPDQSSRYAEYIVSASMEAYKPNL